MSELSSVRVPLLAAVATVLVGFAPGVSWDFDPGEMQEEMCFDEQQRVMFPPPPGEDCPEDTVSVSYDEHTSIWIPIAEEDSDMPPLYFTIDGAGSVFAYDNNSEEYVEVVAELDELSDPTVVRLDLDQDGSQDIVVFDANNDTAMFFGGAGEIDGDAHTSADASATVSSGASLSMFNDDDEVDVLEATASDGTTTEEFRDAFPAKILAGY